MLKKVVSMTIMNILACCLVVGTVDAQWVKIGGPWCGKNTTVRALTTSNNNLFAGTWDYGVHLSTDSGTTWNEIDVGFKTPYTWDLATVNDNQVFASFQDGSLFRTTDNGAHWKEVDEGLNGMVYSLSGNGAMVFAGTNMAGFLSTDSGEHWNQVLPENNIRNVLVTGSIIYAGSNIGHGVFRSLDSGSSWTAVNTGLLDKSIYALSNIGPFILAGTSEGTYRSIDSGSHWIKMNSCLTDSSISCFLAKGPFLFAGINWGNCQGNVYRSNDSGWTWEAANGGLPLNTPVFNLVTIGSKLFACNDSGVYCSSNNGDSWVPVDADLKVSTIKSLATMDGQIIAGSTCGIAHSSDNGENWSLVNPASVSTIAAGNRFVFAGSDSGFLRSVDSGAHWATVSTNHKNIVSLLLNGTNIFAGTGTSFQSYPAGSGCTGAGSNSISESMDTGRSWNTISSGLPYSCMCMGSMCQFSAPGVQSFAMLGRFLFAAVPDSGVFRSADNGTSWSSSNSGLTNRTVVCLAITSGSIFAGTAGSGVFRSNDSGASWTPVISGLTSTKVQCLLAKGTDLFAGTKGGGVFYTRSFGASWSDITGGLTQANIYSLAADDNYLYAGTGDFSGRIWKLKLPEVTKQITKSVRLKQSFFKQTSHNLVVSLEFTLLHPDYVALNAYSLSGRLIAVLVNGRLGAGKHVITWDAHDLAFGCYTIKCQAGVNSQISSVPLFR